MTIHEEPVHIGSMLQERVADLHARWPEHLRQVDDPTDAVDDELDDLRTMGRQVYRGEAWRRAIPSRLSWARLDDITDAAVAADLGRWATADTSANLVLTGEVGTGKSHAAVAAVRPAFDEGMSVAFWPMVELLDALRPGGPQDMLGQLIDVDRLVLDDVGAERPTDWTGERLYAVVNRRWLEERPTVFTTNLDVGELREAVGMRTYSRIVGSDAVVLGLTGCDRRRGV